MELSPFFYFLFLISFVFQAEHGEVVELFGALHEGIHIGADGPQDGLGTFAGGTVQGRLQTAHPVSFPGGIVGIRSLLKLKISF